MIGFAEICAAGQQGRLCGDVALNARNECVPLVFETPVRRIYLRNTHLEMPFIVSQKDWSLLAIIARAMQFQSPVAALIVHFSTKNPQGNLKGTIRLKTLRRHAHRIIEGESRRFVWLTIHEDIHMPQQSVHWSQQDFLGQLVVLGHRDRVNDILPFIERALADWVAEDFGNLYVYKFPQRLLEECVSHGSAAITFSRDEGEEVFVHIYGDCATEFNAQEGEISMVADFEQFLTAKA